MSDIGAEARLRREAGEAAGGGSWLLLAVVLALACLLVRVQGLMALPIFGDEAIYLRWAQLVRQGHPWVSLADPKPPLHFWLIAAVFDWTHDPLAAVRMISVLAGMLSVPAAMAICAELGRLLRSGRGTWGPPAASGHAAGAIVAILLIFSPFFSFYQRLATADALFAAEMLAVVGLSLAWARQAWAGRGWWPAAGLGVLMGAALMTRQGLSYTLWGVPLAAAIIHGVRAGRRIPGRSALKVAGQFILAAAIAAAIWSPYLLARLPQSIADAQADAAPPPPAPTQALSAWDIVRQRIVYQDQFSAADHRSAILRRNLEQTFAPTWTDARGRRIGGWLWTYLTWPVYLAGLAGLLWLALRGQWSIAALLLAWGVLMLAPVVVLGNVVYSRYVLAGAAPLLLAAGWLTADVLALAFLLPPKATAAAWALVLAVLAGLLYLPLREIGRQSTDWRRQTLTPRDRYQYLAGWTAGLATMQAVHALQEVARRSGSPLVVITDTAWGLPADAAWVYLSRTPGIRVYFTSRSGEPILIPVAGAPAAGQRTFWLRPDKWLFRKQVPVQIPADAGVFYITNDPIHAGDGDHPAPDALRKLNANLPPPWTFYGIDGPVSQPGRPGADDQVDVFRLQ